MAGSDGAATGFAGSGFTAVLSVGFDDPELGVVASTLGAVVGVTGPIAAAVVGVAVGGVVEFEARTAGFRA